ncbi:MAG: YCF48-related protein, partial [Candidatus Uhrbacteria bacterium]|nr:YCF48-related protein [Candidatus Uhrbacteria bacterium]
MHKSLRFLASVAAFLPFLIPAFARAEAWVALDTPTDLALYGVDCVSSSACIAVGDTGTVLYTTDRYTWNEGSSGVSVALLDVEYYSSTLAFAVGGTGTIIKSTDGGATWTSMTSGTTETLNDIAMASSTIGWAVGEDGQIRKTTDGGTTWTNVGTSSMDARTIDAVSTSVVWVGGSNGSIVRSTDGGTTWTSLATALGTTSDLTTIDAVSSTTAYVGGEARLFSRTTDSGATWTALTSTNFDAGEYVSDIAMYTSSFGSVVGNNMHIVSISSSTTVAAESVVGSMTGFYDVAAPSAGVRFATGLGVIALFDPYGPDEPAGFGMSDDDGVYTNDLTPSFKWDAAVDDEGDIDHYEFST